MSKTTITKDVIIMGSGPSGLAAAIYASRAGLDTIVIDNYISGGQAAISDTIENYPGFIKITGAELSERMKEQAEKSGAIINQLEEIKNVSLSGQIKEVETANTIYQSKVLMIATGAYPVPLPVENEEKFRGKGIHYCAVCDGAMYKGKTIAVVGGGNSAIKEALFLSNIAHEVILIRRKNSFHAEKVLIEKVQRKNNIKIMYNTDVVGVDGKDSMDTLIIKGVKTPDKYRINVSAVFVCIGRKPSSELFCNYVQTQNGYIVTDERMQTDISGVYAIGDIRVKEYRQLTTAVSDGTIAALEAEQYIAK